MSIEAGKVPKILKSIFGFFFQELPKNYPKKSSQLNVE